MQTQHAVVWLDHREAEVFFFNRETSESVKLATTLAHHQTHNKAGTVDGKRALENGALYHDVVNALNRRITLRRPRSWLMRGHSSAPLTGCCPSQSGASLLTPQSAAKWIA